MDVDCSDHCRGHKWPFWTNFFAKYVFSGYDVGPKKSWLNYFGFYPPKKGPKFQASVPMGSFSKIAGGPPQFWKSGGPPAFLEKCLGLLQMFSFSSSPSPSEWVLLIFWLRLIEADDDDDNFLYKHQKKLSLVPDELGRIKKKKIHQNLTPDMMETFFDGPPHSKCLENAKNVVGRSARLYDQWHMSMTYIICHFLPFATIDAFFSELIDRQAACKAQAQHS